MKRRRKIKVLILSSILIGSFIFSLYIGDKQKREIENYGEFGEAVITKVYSLKSKGNYVNYDYIVGNITYTGSKKYTAGKYDPQVGQYYRIKFSTKTPRFSVILFDELIDD